ncbi:hypothetical protein OIU85_002165 [Salix viminalis]|uniref:Uncharacterized protein n=4 Tax=Salix TaxID=40685 RepID=A0A9Q0VMT6_SALVM|nr:hypothetical protein OIU85_002165 [Salix viminalis]
MFNLNQIVFMSNSIVLENSVSVMLSSYGALRNADLSKMKKGIHPQMQWISYVTQDGRLMHAMMTKIHHVGNVYHFRAKRQMAESLGQIAKFKRRYGQLENAEDVAK